MLAHNNAACKLQVSRGQSHYNALMQHKLHDKFI